MQYVHQESGVAQETHQHTSQAWLDFHCRLQAFNEGQEGCESSRAVHKGNLLGIAVGVMDTHSVHWDGIRLRIKTCIMSSSQSQQMHTHTDKAAIADQGVLSSFSTDCLGGIDVSMPMLQDRICILASCWSS